MHEFRLRHGIEEHRHEIGDFHAHGVRVELGADGVLHPAIRDQDPQRRQVGAERQKPCRDEMLHLAQLVPREEEQPDEGGFEEERHQPFDGQRRAEHVAHIMRVIGPVGAELEFHGDAGGDAHGEVDAEEHAPELHELFPDLAPGHHIDRLHDAKQDGEAQRQRHEEEVIERRQRELQAREFNNIHVSPRSDAWRWIAHPVPASSPA